jgi:hypothetical protein
LRHLIPVFCKAFEAFNSTLLQSIWGI